MGDKFSEEEKTKLLDMVKEHQAYLDDHQDASAEEYEAKTKELEGVFQPIMTKIYQSMGGQEGGMPGGMGGMPGGMGGMPGGMGGMPGGQGSQNMQQQILMKLLSNPETAAYFQDADFMAKFGEIQKNPANLQKYMNDPKIMKAFQVITEGAGMFNPGDSKMSEEEAPKSAPKTEPKKEEPKKEEPKEVKEAVAEKE